jgi:hypothetical protein
MSGLPTVADGLLTSAQDRHIYRSALSNTMIEASIAGERDPQVLADVFCAG